MMGFKQVGRWLWECETCGAHVESGIINLSGHWAECAGKGFTKALIEQAGQDPISERDVEKLKDQHLNK